MLNKILVHIIFMSLIMGNNSVKSQSICSNRLLQIKVGLKEENRNSYEKITGSYFIDFEFRQPIIKYFDMSTSTLYNYKEGTEQNLFFENYNPYNSNHSVYKFWEAVYINQLYFEAKLNFFYPVDAAVYTFINIGYAHQYTEKKSPWYGKEFRNDSILPVELGFEYYYQKFNLMWYYTYRRFFDIPKTGLRNINVLLGYKISKSNSIIIELFRNLDYSHTGGGLGLIISI